MDIPLGKTSEYVDRYTPELLAPMSRAEARAGLGLEGPPPFAGQDVWNGYEFSWLGPRGVPVATGFTLVVDARSPAFIESKSLKLYLGSFAQTRFADAREVTEVLHADLSAGFGAEVAVALPALDRLAAARSRLPGRCLDMLACDVDAYDRNPELLQLAAGARTVGAEAMHTHLFRSLCPVTGQPDWASLLVRYSGPAIEPAALFRYLVSYRQHPAFHESTIEQIFLDLKARCACTRLVVAGFFQRRGGLDINPVRSDGEVPELRYRMPRQ